MNILYDDSRLGIHEVDQELETSHISAHRKTAKMKLSKKNEKSEINEPKDLRAHRL